MRILRVTRPTLHSYVKNGKIKVNVLPSGRYDYDDISVYEFVGREKDRKIVIYVRDDNLEGYDRVKIVSDWCIKNGYTVDGVFVDKNNKIIELMKLVDGIISYNIKKVISLDVIDVERKLYDVLKHVFSKFGTEYVVINSASFI